MAQTKPAFEEKAAPKRGAIREFASYYKPHMRMFVLDLCCALVISLVDILFPVFTRKVLYDYIPNQMMRTFALMALLMLVMFFIRTAAQWLVTYLGHVMGVHIEADMRADIFAHMQKLGFRCHTLHKVIYTTCQAEVLQDVWREVIRNLT